MGHVQDPCCETCQGLVLWDVIWAHDVGRNRTYVVGRVRGPCWGTSSGPMLLRAHVVGPVRDRLCGSCSRSMMWSVFGTHGVRRVLGPCRGMCSRSMLGDAFGPHIMSRVPDPCGGMYSGPLLWDVFELHVVRVAGTYVVGRVRGLCSRTGRSPCCGT